MHRESLDHHDQHLDPAAKLSVRVVLRVFVQIRRQLLQYLGCMLANHRVRHVEARYRLTQIPVEQRRRRRDNQLASRR